MIPGAAAPHGLSSRTAVRRAALTRTLEMMLLWVVLIGVGPADLAIGAVTAAAAAWVSLRLMPPLPTRLRPGAAAALLPRFAWQSVRAGVDVARRALDPRLPVRPGFVTYPVRQLTGPARALFVMMTSLLPGTVPAGDDGATILYHCLDTQQPVTAQLAAEEVVVARALGEPPA